MRIGHGYDVHKLVEGRRCIIGGVYIPFAKGLLGHSDADVLVHAIMDAIIGALCLGDIGKLFPDTDAQYLDADSLELCSKVTEIMENKGYRIGNVDATVIAQAPKMAKYIDSMRLNIADALHTDIDRVSVKATTEENLGFTGEGLGISAHAVCILEEKQKKPSYNDGSYMIADEQTFETAYILDFDYKKAFRCVAFMT